MSGSKGVDRQHCAAGTFRAEDLQITKMES